MSNAQTLLTLFMNKPRIAIDTNVLVSAFRSSQGASSKLLEFVGTELFELNVSVPLFLEYEEKLQERTALSNQAIHDFLAFIFTHSITHKIYFKFPYTSDVKDIMLFDLAFKAQCHYVVSYNYRHLRELEKSGITIVIPF